MPNVLVAVSGGLDSVVLLHRMVQQGHDVALLGDKGGAIAPDDRPVATQLIERCPHLAQSDRDLDADRRPLGRHRLDDQVERVALQRPAKRSYLDQRDAHLLPRLHLVMRGDDPLPRGRAHHAQEQRETQHDRNRCQQPRSQRTVPRKMVAIDHVARPRSAFLTACDSEPVESDIR